MKINSFTNLFFLLLLLILSNCSDNGLDEIPDPDAPNNKIDSLQNVLPSALKYKDFTIKENKVVNKDGNPFQFRGINLYELSLLRWDENGNQLTSKYFDEISSWGVNIIRISINFYEWNHSMGEDEYLKLLDFAINEATRNNIYVILDLHGSGNIIAQNFPPGEYWTPITIPQAIGFWDLISKRYSNNPTVAFYELYNEPVTGIVWGHDYSDTPWLEWRDFYEEVTSVIRKNDLETIILCAGLAFAWDLEGVLEHPVRASNIGYVTHPYPWHGNGISSESWGQEIWKQHIGQIAEKYPVFATEFGYTVKEDSYYNEKDNGAYTVDDRTFADHLVQYLESYNIGWIMFAFCPPSKWQPSLILDYETYTPTESGKHLKELLTR